MLESETIPAGGIEPLAGRSQVEEGRMVRGRIPSRWLVNQIKQRGQALTIRWNMVCLG